MAITDPIADYLTRIRNAILAKHVLVTIGLSSIKKHITEILFDQGYIKKYELKEEPAPQGVIEITLKYHPKTKESAIRELSVISTPGRAFFAKKGEIPSVLNGLGIVIVSTSQGMMIGRKAREKGLGGKLICSIH